MKRISNKISRYDLSFTVDASPDYVANDVLDGLKTISDVTRSGLNSGKIVGGLLFNAASHAIDMSLLFFGANPSNTTFTDNSALDVADADLDKIIGILDLTKHKQFADNSFAMPAINQLPLPFELSVDSDGKENNSIYVVALAGGTINMAATTDLSGAVFIKHD